MCCVLRGWSALYIIVGSFSVFIITYRTFKYGNTEGTLQRSINIGGSLFYALTNITVVAKYPVGTRYRHINNSRYYIHPREYYINHASIDRYTMRGILS